MTHTLSLPVSRYGLAGFISLITTLLLFLILFEAIRAPDDIIIVPKPIQPPPAFTTLDKPKPKELTEIKKPEFNPAGPISVILPPTITTTTPELKVLRPDRPTIEVGHGTGGGPPTALEGEVMTLVKIPPAYPIGAETQGVEGYVIIEYNVTAYGTTSDIRIVEAKPDNIFDKASIDAAAKFKFKPRVLNGAPVETRGLRDKFVYELK